MRVIRCGQRRKAQRQQWSDTEILQAFWDMEEQMGLRTRKTVRESLAIPELNPVPETVNELHERIIDDEAR